MKHGYMSEMFVSFQGEGSEVGRRHLFIRFSGCNLRCRYCDTPNSLVREQEFTVYRESGPLRLSNPVGRDEVLKWAKVLVEEKRGVDGVALTGGEPLLQADFLAEILTDSDLPRPRLLETSGMMPERLLLVRSGIDVVSMDMKIPSNTGEPAFWAEHRAFLEHCQGRAYVKILIDEATSSADLERALEIIRDVAPHSSVFLQPITGADHSAQVSMAQLSQSFSIARNYVSDVRVLPQTHKMMGIR